MVGRPFYPDESKKYMNEKIEELRNRTHQFYVETTEDFYSDEAERAKNDYLEPWTDMLKNKDKTKNDEK